MTPVQIFLLCSSFFLKFTVVSGNLDPCNNYQSINNPYRSSKYKVSAGEVLICDNKLTPGWYRFSSIVGGKIPTTKPEPYYCGTVAPIWMKGKHPTTKGNVTQATACTNLHNRRNGCFFPMSMSVKNCGKFFVYNLKPARACSAAYCAGNLMPCPKGQTGISPNCSISVIASFPYRFVPIPTVTYLDNNKPKVTMLCKFQFPLWKNVSFQVEWFTDGYSVKNDTICKDQDPDNEGPACKVRQSEIQHGFFQAGHRLRCRLRMRYTTSTENKWTTLYRDSRYYFVGIEVSPTHVVVKECDTDTKVKVTLRPTVPVVPDEISVNDYVSVNIYVPTKYKGMERQSAIDSCDLKMRSTDIKNGKEIKIKGICDNQNEPPNSLEYNFAIENTHPFWSFYRLPSVRVTIDNTEQNQCKSTGDPHYTTFDGRYYDFYKPGDYVLYSNKKRKFEVHTRLWFCGSTVTCNCGVAIREGNDVIVITACNHQLQRQPTLLRTQIRSTGQLARGTHIYKRVDGNTITHNVVLPSGARIKAIRYSWGMNMFLDAPKRDAANTAGLCGDFNGNPNDDLNKGGDKQGHSNPTSFGNSWRVTPDKSYFEVLPPKEPVKDDGKSCICPTERNKNNIADCKDNSNRFTGFGPDPGEDIARNMQGGNRRSIQDSLYTDDIVMDYEERSFFVDDNEANAAAARLRVRRDVGGYPKENATRYCKSVIEDSTAGKTCSNVPGFNILTAMQQCVTDLEITGDEKFAGSAFDAMKEGCEEVALKNVSLFTKDENGQLKPPAEIGENLCPNDCSSHGNCTNRTCICEEGYTSADCSMLVNAVPVLLGIYDGGLCDIRRRPCKKTDIFGQDFISSENLTCHVKEFKVVSSNWIPKPYPLKYPGKMIDIFGVRCSLPDPPIKMDYGKEGTPAGGLTISISNDGEHKSERQMRFISYDSVCMACNKSGSCATKDNSCLINGHCFAANQSNPRDWCKQCMPGESQSTWIRRKVNHPPQFATNQSLRYAIQGEYLQLQLQATDPDNRPVTYSLLSSTAVGYTFSPTGLLTWNVTTQDNKQFVFKVTDECNASDTITVTIRIVVCPCQNGGKCLPHPYYPRGSGQYYCNCPLGFTGNRCQTNTDDCVAVNCGNGTCIDGVNNYTCSCHVGFTGSLCDQRLTRCTNQTCFPGVNCTEISNGISCGPCPVGFSGNGKTCVAPTTTGRPTTIVTTTEAPTTTGKPTTTEAQTTTSKPTTNQPTTNQPTTKQVQTTITQFIPSSRETTTEKDVTAASEEPTATETSKTTSTLEPEPTTEYEEELTIRAEIRILVKWNEDLKNKHSSAFISFVRRFEEEIRHLFKKANNGELIKVTVISLRQGSVVAEFDLVFEKKQKDPLAPLKASVQDGKIGTLPVDPVSLNIITENKDPQDKKDNTILIVLVVVGIIVAILVISALLIMMYRKKQRMYHLRQKRVSHLEPELPLEHDAEKYEMDEPPIVHDQKKKDEGVTAKENPAFDH